MMACTAPLASMQEITEGAETSVHYITPPRSVTVGGISRGIAIREYHQDLKQCDHKESKYHFPSKAKAEVHKLNDAITPDIAHLIIARGEYNINRFRCFVPGCDRLLMTAKLIGNHSSVNLEEHIGDFEHVDMGNQFGIIVPANEARTIVADFSKGLWCFALDAPPTDGTNNEGQMMVVAQVRASFQSPPMPGSYVVRLDDGSTRDKLDWLVLDGPFFAGQVVECLRGKFVKGWRESYLE